MKLYSATALIGLALPVYSAAFYPAQMSTILEARDLSCPRNNSFRCPTTKAGKDFCCPSGTDCLPILSGVKMACCNEGDDCRVVAAITCPTSATTPVEDLASIQTCTNGTAAGKCCPLGYSCTGEFCQLPKEDWPTQTAASPTLPSATTTPSSSNTSTSSAQAGSAGSEALCPRFPITAILIGFFPGLAVGVILASAIACILFRRSLKERRPISPPMPIDSRQINLGFRAEKSGIPPQQQRPKPQSHQSGSYEDEDDQSSVAEIITGRGGIKSFTGQGFYAQTNESILQRAEREHAERRKNAQEMPTTRTPPVWDGKKTGYSPINPAVEREARIPPASYSSPRVPAINNQQSNQNPRTQTMITDASLIDDSPQDSLSGSSFAESCITYDGESQISPKSPKSLHRRSSMEVQSSSGVAGRIRGLGSGQFRPLSDTTNGSVVTQTGAVDRNVQYGNFRAPAYKTADGRTIDPPSPASEIQSSSRRQQAQMRQELQHQLALQTSNLVSSNRPRESGYSESAYPASLVSATSASSDGVPVPLVYQAQPGAGIPHVPVVPSHLINPMANNNAAYRGDGNNGHMYSPV